jgi:adenosylhomocysteine nucleosidase
MAYESIDRERMPSTVGIVVALMQEARMFGARLPGPNEVARIDRHLLVCVGGVGAARAHAAARLLVMQGASALMSWGVAAALIPGLESGSLLLPGSVVGSDGVVLPVDSAWHESLRDDASLDVRPLAEASSMLTTRAQKLALGDAAQAVAADMESAAVGRVARQAGIPFLIVRAVCDDCETAVPSWLMHCMDARGKVDRGKFFGELLRHPHHAIGLARIGCGFASAQGSLERFKGQHLGRLALCS